VGYTTPKGTVIGSFNYAEQNDNLKILIEQFWGKGYGKGARYIQLFEHKMGH